MIDALLEALALKDVPRTGWRRRGLDDVESVAAHSWGMALLVLVFCPPELNRERCLTYAVLHDLAEAWTGDHPPQDGVEDKSVREDAAMVALFARLQRPELLVTWRDYEAQVDAEARFVKQLDRLDMGLQAQRYVQRGLDPTEFLNSARTQLDTAQSALLDASAPVATASVRFTGHPSLVAMAAALAVHRFAGRLHVAAEGPATSPLIHAVLSEDDVAPFHPTVGAPADLVVAIGPACADRPRQLTWTMSPPPPTTTAHRICRDALRRRLDGLAVLDE